MRTKFPIRMEYNLRSEKVIDPNLGAEKLSLYLMALLTTLSVPHNSTFFNAGTPNYALDIELISLLLKEIPSRGQASAMKNVIAVLSSDEIFQKAIPELLTVEVLRQFFTYFSDHLQLLSFELIARLYPKQLSQKPIAPIKTATSMVLGYQEGRMRVLNLLLNNPKLSLQDFYSGFRVLLPSLAEEEEQLLLHRVRTFSDPLLIDGCDTQRTLVMEHIRDRRLERIARRWDKDFVEYMKNFFPDPLTRIVGSYLV